MLRCENPENAMEAIDERESIEVGQKADIKARVLLDIGLRMPHKFSRNNLTLPPMTAFQSQVLVRALLKLGLFSMNIPSMATIEAPGHASGISFRKVPDAILAMGMHYAITVSPTDPDQDEPVILIDELERHVKRLEGHFGVIGVDMEVVSRIARLAREEVHNLELTAERV
jgi:hypothetical protein